MARKVELPVRETTSLYPIAIFHSYYLGVLKITLKAAVSLTPIPVVIWTERRKNGKKNNAYFNLGSYMLMVFVVAPHRMDA